MLFVYFMEMIKVSSSNLVSIGYDESTKILIVKFHNGVYKYLNVPKNIYLGLIDSSSKGTYFHDYIRDQFTTEKIN